MFLDSQVALTWILSNKAPRKNIFVNNRLKEISNILETIGCNYGQVSFTYVPSEQNQADFLTKPYGSKVFKEKFDWWINGARWLLAPPQEWPKGQLGCIPYEIKSDLVNAAIAQVDTAPVVDVNTFSSYSHL